MYFSIREKTLFYKYKKIWNCVLAILCPWLVLILWSSILTKCRDYPGGEKQNLRWQLDYAKHLVFVVSYGIDWCPLLKAICIVIHVFKLYLLISSFAIIHLNSIHWKIKLPIMTKDWIYNTVQLKSSFPTLVFVL